MSFSFNSAQVHITKILDSVNRYFLRDGESVYLLDGQGSNLTISYGDNFRNSSTIENFSNGENGIVLPDEFLVKNDFSIPTNILGYRPYHKTVDIDGQKFLLVWSAYTEVQNCGDDGCDGEIYGLLVDKTTGPTGSEFKINSKTIQCYHEGLVDNKHIDVAVTGLSNGNFVIAWKTDTNNCSYYSGWKGVAAQIITADGQKVGEEVLVGYNDYGTHIDNDIALAPLSGGRFVVVYAGAWDMRGKIFSSDGTELETFYSEYNNKGHHFGDLSLATLADDNFALVYGLGLNWGTENSSNAIMAEVRNSNSEVMISPFPVVTDGTLLCGSVFSNIDTGKFVVSWLDRYAKKVMLNTYLPGGEFEGSLEISDNVVDGGRCTYNDLTFLSNGNLFAYYREENQLLATLLDKNGEVVGSDIEIEFPEGDASVIRVQSIGENEVVVTSVIADNGNEYIQGKVLDTDSIAGTEECGILGTEGNDLIEFPDSCENYRIVTGFAGDDVIHSGTGVSVISGGSGSDRFELCVGTDITILDFENSDSIRCVRSMPIAEQVGYHTRLTVGKNQVITLVNVDIGSLYVNPSSFSISWRQSTTSTESTTSSTLDVITTSPAAETVSNEATTRATSTSSSLTTTTTTDALTTTTTSITTTSTELTTMTSAASTTGSNTDITGGFDNGFWILDDNHVSLFWEGRDGHQLRVTIVEAEREAGVGDVRCGPEKIIDEVMPISSIGDTAVCGNGAKLWLDYHGWNPGNHRLIGKYEYEEVGNVGTEEPASASITEEDAKFSSDVEAQEISASEIAGIVFGAVSCVLLIGTVIARNCHSSGSANLDGVETNFSICDEFSLC